MSLTISTGISGPLKIIENSPPGDRRPDRQRIAFGKGLNIALIGMNEQAIDQHQMAMLEGHTQIPQHRIDRIVDGTIIGRLPPHAGPG